MILAYFYNYYYTFRNLTLHQVEKKKPKVKTEETAMKLRTFFFPSAPLRFVSSTLTRQLITACVFF